MTEKNDGPGTGADGFTAEEDRIYREAFDRIREALGGGASYEEACRKLEITDEGLRRVIVTDFLKVTIAERHFSGRDSVEDVAGALKLPVEQVMAARTAMLGEVAAASVKKFRETGGEGVFDEPEGDAGGAKKGPGTH